MECMKIEKRSVGRPKTLDKRLRYNIALSPKLKLLGAQKAFSDNKSFSRYVEDLISADIEKAKV